MDSHDTDSHDEEPTEKDALNSDNSRQGTSKQERWQEPFGNPESVLLKCTIFYIENLFIINPKGILPLCP
jgi:hypothetical protein